MRTHRLFICGVSALLLSAAGAAPQSLSRQQLPDPKAPRLLSPRLMDLRQWQFHYPKPVPYRFGIAPNLRRLADLHESSKMLDGVPVEAPLGKWAGRIKAVATDSYGTPTRVEIALNKRVAVMVQPGSLKFDVRQHIAFTDISSNRLWHLPNAMLIPPQ